MYRFIKKWLPAWDEVRRPARFARQSIAMMRREYQGKPLDEQNVDPDPIKQFDAWFSEAVSSIKDDPNAMILSTADKLGNPAARTVLLKDFDENGFVFYTNYGSRKAEHIHQNSQVALTFIWPELVRQVCIEGKAEKIPAKQSDDYFNSRPYSSRISAIASPQSQVVSSRAELENRVEELQEKFKNEKIHRPDSWGGYIVKPERIEFWQGRMNRLHDRIVYKKGEENTWHNKRLAP